MAAKRRAKAPEEVLLPEFRKQLDLAIMGDSKTRASSSSPATSSVDSSCVVRAAKDGAKLIVCGVAGVEGCLFWEGEKTEFSKDTR